MICLCVVIFICIPKMRERIYLVIPCFYLFYLFPIYYCTFYDIKSIIFLFYYFLFQIKEVSIIEYYCSLSFW